MFVNFLSTSMLLSRGVFREGGGYGGSDPRPGSVIYMLFEKEKEM